MDANQVLEIVERIDNLYQHAWGTLLWALTGLIALTGVVIPLLQNYYSRRQLRQDREELRKIIEVEMSNGWEQLKNEIDVELEDVRTDIERSAAMATGGLYMIQANLSSSALSTVHSRLKAISFMCAAQDFSNLRRVVRSLNASLQSNSAPDYGRLRSVAPEVDSIFDEAVQQLNDSNDNGHLSDLIRELELRWAEYKAKSGLDEDVGAGDQGVDVHDQNE
jgi:hypothetical protein